jgi:uncharacterized repeat protein (TIGR03803 family)
MNGRRAMMLRPQSAAWLAWSRLVTGVAVGVIAASALALAQVVSYQVLDRFSDAITEPRRPRAPLIVGVDGYLYGSTSDVEDPLCRSPRCGTVFQIAPDGTITFLFEFSGLHADDGLYPNNGDFYGTTLDGGELGGGVVFRFGVKP